MRNYVLFLFSVILCTISKSQTSLDEGLLLHYKLNGNVNDYGPNHFNGTPNVSYTSDYMGNAANAALFNGINSYIDFPSAPQLKPSLPISIAFRVKFNDLTVQKSWILSTNYSIDSYNGVLVNTNGSQIQFSFGDGQIGVTSGATRRTKTATTALIEGQWYYIVGVIRGATDMDIYVDCINDLGTYSGSGGSMNYNSALGSIGRGDVAGFDPYYLDGSIDDFRYWNRALSPDDVQSLCELIASSTKLETEDIAENAYPNPVKSVLSIPVKNNDPSKPVSIIIFDAAGRTVFEELYFGIKGNSPCQVNLEKLSSGAYFLKTQTSEGTRYQHIVK